MPVKGILCVGRCAICHNRTHQIQVLMRQGWPCRLQL